MKPNRKPVQKETSSRKPWLIAAIAGGVLLAVVAALFVSAGVFHVQVPLISALFTEPLTDGVPHDSSWVDLRLFLPAEWVIQQDSEGTLLASSSQAAFDAEVLPEGAAIIAIIRSESLADSLIGESVNASSAKSIVKFIVEDGLNTNTDARRLGAVQQRTVSGFEAASGSYSFTGGDVALVNYVVAVTTDDGPILIIFISRETSWNTNHRLFDSILDSMIIFPLE